MTSRVQLCRWTAALFVLLGGCLDAGGRSGAGRVGKVDTLFVEGFESGTLDAWPDGVDPSRQRIITDPSQAQSGRRYLDVTYRAGDDGGWLTHFLMPGHDSLYVSYHVRFPEDWQGGTKLVAFYGSRTDDQWSALGKAGTCPTGVDFFATMLVIEPTGNPGPVRFYTYYSGMAREPDGVTCWGRHGDGTESYSPPLVLTPGAWHQLEFMVRLNAPDESNGNQQLWIDGVPRGSWSGLRFRTSPVLRLNAVQLTFNRAHARGTPEQRVLVDNLVVATGRD